MPGPAAVAIALLLGCAATAGCASTTVTKTDSTSGLHQVVLTAQSTSALTALRYTLDPRPTGPTLTGLYVVTKTATRTLRLSGGTRVTMTGGPVDGLADLPGAAEALSTPSSITCTITVDGLEKASSTVHAPKGRLPDCVASAYVGHRPHALRHALQLAALGLCAVIVVAAIGGLTISRRKRSVTSPGAAAADGTDIV